MLVLLFNRHTQREGEKGDGVCESVIRFLRVIALIRFRSLALFLILNLFLKLVFLYF